MKVRSFLLGIALLFLQVLSLPAFEIQFPGEEGFFIGKSMIYLITADSNDKNVGKEGTFTFGANKVIIDNAEYYDCVFVSPSGESHFYMSIDPNKSSLLQKGFDIGITELRVDPAVSALQYPLSPGKTWTGTTKLTAKNLMVPGIGLLPRPVTVENVKMTTKVSSNTINVPAGTFDTLLVENTYSGSLIGIPITLIQRTWLNEDNVPIKRNFEFLLTPTTKYMLYELELSRPSPLQYDFNWDSIINILDVVFIARHFGKQVSKNRIPNPDVDGNGIVNMLDLIAVSAHFGESLKR